MPSPMSISREGLDLLKELEGYRPRAVPLANGRWLIGYGHTKYARANMRVTEPEAELLLRHDLIGVVDELNTKIFAPLSQGQFDALILFAYNIGLSSFRASGVCDLLNVGQPLAAAKEIGRWRVAMVNGAPVVIDALARRRAAELELFLRTPNEVRPATTHLLQPLSEPEADGAASPLQVFNPAPVPTPSASAPSAPVEQMPVHTPEVSQAQEPPTPERPEPPRPPSTLRTRFYDLLRQRRSEGDQGAEGLSVAQTDIGRGGAVILGLGAALFAAISVFGFLALGAADSRPLLAPAAAFGGLTAAALCVSALLRLLAAAKPPSEADTNDVSPEA